MTLASVLVSLWCWSVIAAATIVFGTVAILTAWIPPRGRIFVSIARAWSLVILEATGMVYRIERTAAAAAVPAAIVMPNHQSFLDVLLLFLAVQQPVAFLAKRSLFRVPFLGWSMALAGFIPVDRESPERARDAFGGLVGRIREGWSIIVFPEGTRSRDGTLGDFKRAGFLVALKSGLPIVPIGIRGTREAMGRAAFLVRPGPLVLRMGDPIPTKGLGIHDREALAEQVRREIIRLKDPAA